MTRDYIARAGLELMILLRRASQVSAVIFDSLGSFLEESVTGLYKNVDL